MNFDLQTSAVEYTLDTMTKQIDSIQRLITQHPIETVCQVKLIFQLIINICPNLQTRQLTQLIRLQKNQFHQIINHLEDKLQRLQETFQGWLKSSNDLEEQEDHHRIQLGDIPKPKPLTKWQKFKHGLGKLWNVIKAPASKLISALPFSSHLQKGAEAASGLIKHFQKK
ncbi:Hypothetical_protein [Hexamita inflata]|uniref:Hypothetical_protein n=1 Tax=Hexamita inflata TaxID=28002 RepID=A0ABP1I056_9EUKA